MKSSKKTASVDPVADTEALLQQRASELETARQAHDEAKAARAAAAEADDGTLDKLDNAVAKAATIVARADERHSLAENRLADARAAAEQAALIAIDTDLEARIREHDRRSFKVLPAAMRVVLEILVEREDLAAEVNIRSHRRPDADPIRPPGAIDVSTMRPRKVLREELVELWTGWSGDPIDTSRGFIKENADGSANFIPRDDSGQNPSHRLTKKLFRRVEYVEADPRPAIVELNRLDLPSPDGLGWLFQSQHHRLGAAEQARAALARLDEPPARSRKDEREVKVETLKVPDIVRSQDGHASGPNSSFDGPNASFHRSPDDDHMEAADEPH